MIDKALIEKYVLETIEGSDIFVVDIKVLSGNVIEIVLDNDTSIGIDDCAKVNRKLCEQLGEEDFELSVYSAGLSEPLKLKRQYLKNIGKDVEVIRKSGTKQIGTMVSADDESIVLEYIKTEKIPGAKRKTSVNMTETIKLSDIKSTKIYFKV